ncbi:MAG: DUF362 domain-containing protein [Candidatus Lokiarchaeota archaeon]|nr:DUF362 domain-containing protein [Candidatus Lokiarchaeota archaeon]MBD3342478.1 DUF362 domain-containing protein [Candidatus Lokiarchaeota archaeon]
MVKTKISINKITHDDVKSSVFQSLENIGANELFSKPNLRVLIKPNLLMPKEPERATTTHPDVVKYVIQWVKQFNPENIIVGESSGTKKRGVTEKAFEKSGIKKVCEDEEIEWTPFEQTKRKIYKVENPLVLNEFSSSELIDGVDIIINIPKIKTHGQCLLTCVIKNMFGTLILGNKPQTHARFPRMEDFNRALADIYSVSKPQLTLVDGYYCQEGNGPSAGDVVKLDLVIAGYDPVALDTLVCELIGFNPNEVLYIKEAEKKSLGSSNLQDFELLGDPLDSVKRIFKKPKFHMRNLPIPKFLADYVGRTLFRSSIKFDSKKCRLCGTCWKNCPVKAISPPEVIKKGNKPSWNKDLCITCYCCAELCPYEAVEFKINYIRNIFTSGLGVIFLILALGIIGIIWIIILIVNSLFF